MPDSWQFEVLMPPMGVVAEGPAWDGRYVLFSAIQTNLILRYDTQTESIDVWRTGTHGANGLNFDKNGSLFACESQGRRIARYVDGMPTETVVDKLAGRRINGPNDLAIDPTGRIYFSDRVENWSPETGIDHSSILSADPQEDGTYDCVRRTFDTTMPNGLLFSKDYRTLYVAQSDFRASESRQLRAYPVDEDGSLGEYELLHDFGPHRGIDGMTLTSDGLIAACAGWEISGPGPMITVFDPRGRIVETHPVPAERPANCTFAGSDLYVATLDGRLLRAKDTGHEGFLQWPAN